jgi:anti-sigma28 factor (negative regulator of flagellin synthesis)
MRVQGKSPVESQELQRAREVDRAREAEQRESSNRTDDRRDRVTISDEAREKNRESEIREERVEAARRADNYDDKDLDSKKVAKKVLDEM